MAITLNHTIVSARDPGASAAFLAGLLGLPTPKQVGPFTQVEAGPTGIDFIADDGKITSRHFAFLVSEAEFDAIFGRIRDRGMDYWADPSHRRPGEINRFDDGRGMYFDDPDGHNLEILTRPYCSGGPEAEHPNPLCYP